MKTVLMTGGNFERAANGSFYMLGGIDVAKQNLTNTLKGFLGEWFLDSSYFVDWLNILDKPFSSAKIENAIIDQLNRTGIPDDIIFVIVNLDKSTRIATTVFLVTVDGEMVGNTIQENF